MVAPRPLNAALAAMVSSFVIFGLLFSQSATCVDENASQMGLAASAALQEIAEERGVPEPSAGAVLLLIRQEACDLLEGQPRLWESTRRAIEAECSRVVLLPGLNESDYLRAAAAPISESVPSIVAIAWAVGNDSGNVHHVFLVADGAEALRVVSPGFGREGSSESSCEHSPVALVGPADGGQLCVQADRGERRSCFLMFNRPAAA